MLTTSRQETEALSCKCDACGRHMALLAELSSVGKYEAVNVFRCYGCNSVKSEQEARR
jgi:hypothetical protein